MQRQKTGNPELSEFEVLCDVRTKKVVKEGESKWINKSFELRQDDYCKKFRECRPNDDPKQSPIDPEVCMLAGGGMKNGRLLLGHGSVDTSTTPSLSQLRKMGGKPAIETRPQPSVVMFNELKVCSSWIIHKYAYMFAF